MPPEMDHLAADPVAAQFGAARALAHHGPVASGPRNGTALCLSGGGFRAALFHLGAVRRLDELGVLGQVRTISAVSGGALLASLLTDPRLEWPRANQRDRVGGLDELVTRPLLALTGRNVRTPAMLSRLQPWWRGRSSGQSALAQQFIADVPWWESNLRDNQRGGPAVLVQATEVGYGVGWLFADAASRPPRGRIGDHRLGYAAPPPGLRIADAVAASCSHPPWFPPIKVDGRTLGLVGGVPDPHETPERREEMTSMIHLVDGGVFDNLGLEPVWSDHETILVSDGGAVERGHPPGSALSHLWHLLSIAAGGGKTTRMRWLHAAYNTGAVRGATWSMQSPRAISAPDDVLQALRQVRTDLDAFAPAEQQLLEQHGYLVADASLRKHAPELLASQIPLAMGDRVGEGAGTAAELTSSARVTAWGRRRPRSALKRERV